MDQPGGGKGVFGLDLPTLAGIAIGLAAPGGGTPETRQAFQTFQGFREFEERQRLQQQEAEERRHMRESLLQEREERRGEREAEATFLPRFIESIRAGTPLEGSVPARFGGLVAGVEQQRFETGQRRPLADILGLPRTGAPQVPPPSALPSLPAESALAPSPTPPAPARVAPGPSPTGLPEGIGLAKTPSPAVARPELAAFGEKIETLQGALERAQAAAQLETLSPVEHQQLQAHINNLQQDLTRTIGERTAARNRLTPKTLEERVAYTLFGTPDLGELDPAQMGRVNNEAIVFRDVTETTARARNVQAQPIPPFLRPLIASIPRPAGTEPPRTVGEAQERFGLVIPVTPVGEKPSESLTALADNIGLTRRFLQRSGEVIRFAEANREAFGPVGALTRAFRGFIDQLRAAAAIAGVASVDEPISVPAIAPVLQRAAAVGIENVKLRTQVLGLVFARARLEDVRGGRRLTVRELELFSQQLAANTASPDAFIHAVRQMMKDAAEDLRFRVSSTLLVDPDLFEPLSVR